MLKGLISLDASFSLINLLMAFLERNNNRNIYILRNSSNNIKYGEKMIYTNNITSDIPRGSKVNLEFRVGDSTKGNIPFIARNHNIVHIPINPIDGLDKGTYVAEVVGYNKTETAVKVKVLGEAVMDIHNPNWILVDLYRDRTIISGEVDEKIITQVECPCGVETKVEFYTYINQVPNHFKENPKFKEALTSAISRTKIDELYPSSIFVHPIGSEQLRKGNVTVEVTYPNAILGEQRVFYTNLEKIPDSIKNDNRFKKQYEEAKRDAQQAFMR